MLTKENEQQGFIINITGDGKGKSTSAFGMAVRALGWGWKIGFFQFLKSGMETGEKRFFSTLPENRILFDQLGAGLSWKPGDHKGLAVAGWNRVKPYLTDPHGNFQLLILDELNVALSLGYLETDEVIQTLKRKRPDLNVLITGRGAPAELLEISDLVSEIQNKKHPFEKGIPARKGIDF